jgi:[ribosomal protein S5]-alanine N-acetyltransferase
MEKMPYSEKLDAVAIAHTIVRDVEQVTSANWRDGLPVLCGKQVVLRELRQSDARSLFALLTAQEVARFISPPPSTIEGFERFIAWTIRQRNAGTYACFAVTLQRSETAIGIFQVRQLDGDFRAAEWGFAIGSPFWGTGVFQEGAELMMEFVFDTVGVHRLEARAAAVNGRGNRALQKIGAVQEAILRKSFQRDGQYIDQLLYAILDEEWRSSRDATCSTRPIARQVSIH